jgi:hypothetical protein
MTHEHVHLHDPELSRALAESHHTGTGLGEL